MNLQKLKALNLSSFLLNQTQQLQIKGGIGNDNLLDGIGTDDMEVAIGTGDIVST